jgi:hypothetical protein
VGREGSFPQFFATFLQKNQCIEFGKMLIGLRVVGHLLTRASGRSGLNEGNSVSVYFYLKYLLHIIHL